MTSPAAAASNRRAMVMGAIGLGVVLLVFIATRLAGGGGSDDAIPVPDTVIPPTTTTVPEEVPDLETFEVFTTKNPFTPLAGAPVGSSAGSGSSGSSGGTGSTSGGSTSGGSSGGTSGGSSSGGSGSTSGSGSGGAAEPARSQRVALVDIFVENGRTMANVKVDDTVHKVGEGDAFARSYRVVSLSASDDCGRFVFGDDQFRLCVGEEVIK
jgi:hypothetical protein